MAKAQLKLQVAGRRQILDAASGLSFYNLTSFVVGSLPAFAATDTETAARGTVNFTGSSDLIQRRRLPDDTTRIVLTMPEGVGPFDVGNILLYSAGSNDQTPKPFASVILPFVIVKKLAVIDPGILNLPNPGNRLVINITLAHRVLEAGVDADVTVEVVAPDFANMASFDNEANVPPPNLSPWKQFMLARANLTGGPALVAAVSPDAYWIMPFWRDLRAPDYHVLSGGVYGDNYRERRYGWYWGQRYSTPDSQFKGVIGGQPYTATREECGRQIGGLPYDAK